MITSKIISNGILRALTTVLIVCSVLYFLYEIQTVIIYLCISLMLCLIANPLIQFLKSKLKFSNTLAAITTLLLFILLLVGFILLFVPLIISQANNLSLLDTNNLQQQFELKNNRSDYIIELTDLLDNEFKKSAFEVAYQSYLMQQNLM